MERFVRLPLMVATALITVWGAHALADATIPTKDITGAKDNPLLKRYEGSLIVSYESLAFTDFRVPLSPLVQTGKTDSMNNAVFLPKQEKQIEGGRTRIAYLVPAGRSSLEVLRNYEEEIKARGGEVVFTCKGEECGGDATRSSAGGGGATSLMMYFAVERDLKDPNFSNGHCALTRSIADQRFSAGRIPQSGGEAYVTVHTYQLLDDLYCKAFNGRTIAVVHVVEPTPREQKMVLVKAEEMARSFSATGKVALYGIFFDHDKTEIKPESAPAIAEIVTLMKANPQLSVLVVGHTDRVGGFDYNVDLSRRRAHAVVAALVSRHGIAAGRLKSNGVGMSAPAASNYTEDGRAKNRRVELVKLN